MQNFSDLVQENIFKYGLNEGGIGSLIENGRISETVKDKAKVTMNQWRI